MKNNDLHNENRKMIKPRKAISNLSYFSNSQSLTNSKVVQIITLFKSYIQNPKYNKELFEELKIHNNKRNHNKKALTKKYNIHPFFFDSVKKTSNNGYKTQTPTNAEHQFLSGLIDKANEDFFNQCKVLSLGRSKSPQSRSSSKSKNLSDYIKDFLIHSNSKVSLDKQFETSLRYSLSNNDKIEETNDPIYFILQKRKKLSMLHLINVNDIELRHQEVIKEEEKPKGSEKENRRLKRMNSVYDSYSDEEEDYSDEDYYINPNSSI